MKPENIFDLIGNDENALTKSLAFQCLHHRNTVLKAVLSLFDIKRMSSDKLKNVKIEVQVHEGKEGITDIEFELEDEFIVILEAKLDASAPTDWKEQLHRYHSVLVGKQYSTKKLIFVSDTIQTDNKEFSGLIDGIERRWISWKDIYEKLIKLKEMYDTIINRQFMQFFKEMLTVKEIIIIPIGSRRGELNPIIEWKIIENEHFCRKSKKPMEAQYIAFYTEKKGIEKMAKLEVPYTRIKRRELNKIMSKYYGTENFYSDKPLDVDVYLLKFGKIFNLPRAVIPGGWGPRKPIACTFEELLTAESVKKLHSKMDLNLQMQVE